MIIYVSFIPEKKKEKKGNTGDQVNTSSNPYIVLKIHDMDKETDS